MPKWLENIKLCEVGGFNPLEKRVCQTGSFPQVSVNIQNI